MYQGLYEYQYEGAFLGTYTKQYTKEYLKNYLKQWEGSYSSTFTGYYIGGPYATQYGGTYTKIYLAQYTKEYSGQYEGTFEGSYDKEYTGIYTKTYLGNYEQAYTGIYVKQYTKTYTGIYIKQYDQGWIAAYTKEYSGQYEKHYSKTYGNAWSGPGYAGTYESVGLAHFTNNYAGERAFHQSYIGAASTNAIAQSTRAGNITNNARVKIGDEWKSVIRTRVKKDGEWKIVGKTRVKDTSGAWKIIAVDHERVDINITSNTANFNVKDEIENLGYNLLTKPFQVNVNVAPGVFVYSTDPNKAAFDTGFSVGALQSNHKVKILLQGNSYIVGCSGHPGGRYSSLNLGLDGQDGSDAINLTSVVDLFIESYGTIAGGGGGGGSGGYPVNTNTTEDASPAMYGKIGGLGGIGAGWNIYTQQFVSESDSTRQGSDSDYNYGIHGGDGGLLGQLGEGAGGFTADNPSQSEVNPGTQYTQYDMSGNGGKPGSAIKGYDASRVTFINSTESSVWGDSAFKFKA